MTSVWPSGSAFAAAAVPIMVPAPGRVSTITGWPHCSVSFCPMTRARMSVDPPGANGTIILIGLSGYLSAADWASAPPVAKAPAIKSAAPVMPARPVAKRFLNFPSSGLDRRGDNPRHRDLRRAAVVAEEHLGRAGKGQYSVVDVEEKLPGCIRRDVGHERPVRLDASL